MNLLQRIIMILYCVLLVYCCLWIPWYYAAGNRGYVRVGYAWLWVGPTKTQPPPDIFPADASVPPEGVTLDAPQAAVKHPIPRARPDMPLISLRLIAATALGAAAFLLAGIRWKNPATRS